MNIAAKIYVCGVLFTCMGLRIFKAGVSAGDGEGPEAVAIHLLMGTIYATAGLVNFLSD